MKEGVCPSLLALGLPLVQTMWALCVLPQSLGLGVPQPEGFDSLVPSITTVSSTLSASSSSDLPEERDQWRCLF